MAQLCEASTLLRRLTERLSQYNNCQQPDIDSLQQVLDSPLFQTLYNLQSSFQQLKAEFEKGNSSVKNCLFDFDVEGHLKYLNKKITSQNIKNNKRLANDKLVRHVVLNKQTANEPLGFSIIGKKHRLFAINAIFIQHIQAHGLAELNGQLHVGDQIVCINEHYLSSQDSALPARAQQLLSDPTCLSVTLVVIAPTADCSHAATPTSPADGHSCVPTQSTPVHVDMVLNTLWTQIEVVELSNDGCGLGFGITGNKSTGVVVKAIVPGSTVDKDGRIRTGDHIFQINHVSVRGMSSEQVAGILRQSAQQVRLVVARSVREPTSADTATNTPPLTSQRASLTSEACHRTSNPADVPSTRTSLGTINDADGFLNSSQTKLLLRTERLLESNQNFEKILENLREQCHDNDGTELLDVILDKGDDGLGITVAGYVSPDSTNHDAIAGIFIRDIADGSVCARDGRLAVADQIVEVNDQSLHGFSNVQALCLLQSTSSSVRLRVRRYHDEVKYAKIREMIALQAAQHVDNKLEFQSQLDINEQIEQKWTKVLGGNYDILIADVYKPDNGGLGITLEGTVDIENGEEVRPHHYIRALLRDGPIGTQGTLKAGDELLEVNNQVLYGKNHIHVIEILKRVKHQIKLVCARRRRAPSQERSTSSRSNTNRSRSISFGKTAEIVVKAKSLGTLDALDAPIHLLSPLKRPIKDVKSRSLEVISDLALWSTSTIDVELTKGDHGLGFSILDYQDPSNPSHSPVIVIRALVPGGVTQLDGRIVPGDRLVAVNDITLENMTLDDVIKILKSTAKGRVKLSLSKPLPYPKFKNDNEDKLPTDTERGAQTSQVYARSSRLSKSRTTAEMPQPHQRSASTHRPSPSTSVKQPAVSAGIALSAPAILSRHEFIEALQDKENMRKPAERRATSTTRPKTPSGSKPDANNGPVRQLNTEEYLDLLPRKKPPRESQPVALYNLPEFLAFRSDHLVLHPQIASSPFYDRPRGPSAFSSTKATRQSASATVGASATTGMVGGSPRAGHPPTKRASRARTAHDVEQAGRPAALRPTTNTYDTSRCSHEPELSSDDEQNNTTKNNYNIVRPSSSASPLAHRQLIKNVLCPPSTPATVTTIVDEDAQEVAAIIKQHEHVLSNDINENHSVASSTARTPTTPTTGTKWTSSRQSSRMASPALSTSSQSSGRVITFLNHEVIQLPVYLEREIRVKHNFDQLGLVVDAYVDEGVNGCCVRSITPTSTLSNQHGLRPGDYILSINNENMKKISNAQARSIIRRASLIGSDISVIFIPVDDAKQFKDHTLDPQTTLSPLLPEYATERRDTLVSLRTFSATDSDAEPSLVKSLPSPSEGNHADGLDAPISQHTDSTAVDNDALSATLWGPPRSVILYRNEHVKSLGISIVGGKLDFSGPGNTIESCISGTFIKHVLPDSPAGRNGTLKTGDLILEVNGHNLRDASHDRAVEIIRAAQSPVHFIVQSLLDPSNPTAVPAAEPSSASFSHIPSASPGKVVSISKTPAVHEGKAEDELLRQYGHLNGDLFYIDIRRSLAEVNEPLGLSLIGHRDPHKLAVFVCDIQPSSLLDRDGRIRPGDQLLEVNGEILLGKAHSTVTPIIKSIKADTLNFVLLRNPNAISDMALNSQHAAAARLRASAMAASDVHLTSMSSKLVRAPPASSSPHPAEAQMTNDASQQQRVHVPRHSPDVNEHKESDDRPTSASALPLTSRPRSASNDIENRTNARAPPATVGNGQFAGEEQTRLASSNRMSPGSNNNDVSLLNHNICSHTTSTDMHSASSDAGSPTQRAIPSTVDQQSGAYGNGQSPAALPASVLTHEQTNHANHPDWPTPLETVSPARSNQSQSSKDETSSTQASPVTPLGEALQETANISPSAVSVSSPSKEKATRDNSSDVPTTPVRTATTTTTSATNGASKACFSNMSTSSSSASSLSVSTPSSAEHATRKQVPPVSSTQVARRISMSAPGAPITLILNKDQKGSFGLTVAQHDNEIWVQSVQPHGPADQQDIRAGDHLTQINGTPVEALKFADVQNMLEHANSNQIHLTCVPYREPQPQPVVVSLSQVDSLPMLAADDADTNKEDDPRTRSIVVGQETLIEIDRGQSGLGLSVVGGSDTQLSGIIIHDIYDGCAAQRDSRLLVGDQILEVNSVDLRFATHEEAIQALRQATTIVRIVVLRGRLLTEMTNEQEKFDLFTVELSKKSGKGLGFSIIGRRHGFGVFISHILEGGSAEKDGRLMSGDLILEVNGQDLRTAAYEHVAYTLKTLPHGRVNIKIGRLKASTPLQSRQHATSHDRKNRSRSSSSNFRRTSASKVNDR